MAIEKKEKSKPAAKKAGTAVTKAEPAKTALATQAQMAMLEQAAQQDRHTFGKDDLATPFLRVLQPLSPQVLKGNDKYVDGAEAGMFLDTAENELWEGEDGITVVPVHYTPSFIEWKLREAGGGLVKDYGAVAPDLPTTRDDKNREILPSGNQLVKSGLYYVFVVDEATGKYKALAMPLAGMQLKKSRNWNTRMKSIRMEGENGTFTPPMYYHSWKITSVFEENDQGSWFGVNIEPYKPLPELGDYGWGLVKEAMDFKEMILGGQVKVKHVEEELVEDAEIEEADTANVPNPPTTAGRRGNAKF
jgi:hypothetical protein